MYCCDEAYRNWVDNGADMDNRDYLESSIGLGRFLMSEETKKPSY